MKTALNGNGLSRDLSLFSATALVVANMVGTGIFTTSGFIMAELGNPGALFFCWLCGGIFALCGALCYGELGSRFPRAGGDYIFLKESFGKLAGFLSGWISLTVGFSAPIAAASLAFATYLFQAFSFSTGHLFAVSLFGVPITALSLLNLVAIGVIILFSLIHCHSLHMGSRIQNGLTLFKVSLVVIFIAAGILSGDGSIHHFSVTTDRTTFSAEKFAVSLIFVSFAYSGWNAAAYLGGEIVNPRKNIPRSLFLGTFVVIFVYLLLNVIYVYAIPPEDMEGVLEIGTKSAVALFGANISKVFSGAVSLGILSVLSAMIMTGPRIYYAMSKDSIFFHLFGKLNKNRKTPVFSIFLQAAIAVFMVVTASFETLLVYIGFTLSLFAMLTVMGLMRIRRKVCMSEGVYKTFGYPITPFLFILGNLWVIVFSVKSRPVTALYGLATIGLGVIAYLFFAHRQKSQDHSTRISQGGRRNL